MVLFAPFRFGPSPLAGEGRGGGSLRRVRGKLSSRWSSSPATPHRVVADPPPPPGGRDFLSPAAGPPLGEAGALRAEGRVVAVARVHPRLVGQALEHLRLDVRHQRPEP